MTGERNHELNYEVIQDLDDDVLKSFEQRTDKRYDGPIAKVLSEEEQKEFKTMHWPMLDDGKGVGTNALGYPVGGWYQEQQRKKEAYIEVKRKEEEEKQKQIELEAQEKEKQHELTVQELEQIREDARNEGFNEGLAQGRAQGHEEGFSQGHDEGFQKGQEEGLKKGYDDGLLQGREEGFLQGHNDGVKAGEDIVNSQLNRLKILCNMLANPLHDLDKDVVDELVYMLSRLLKVILDNETVNNLNYLQKAIEASLDLLPNAKEGAQISLSEDDYNFILTKVGKDYIKEHNWNLQVDENLPQGTVSVTNNALSVDYKKNERIDALIASFLVNAKAAVDLNLPYEKDEDARVLDSITKKSLDRNLSLANANEFTEDLQQTEALNEADENAENVSNTQG